MASPVFKMNPRFPVEVLRSAELAAYMHERAQPVAERARELAPDDPETGAPDIRTSIGVEAVLDHRGQVARVIAKNFKSWWQEHGTVNMPANPFLRPALAAEGLPPAPADSEEN